MEVVGVTGVALTVAVGTEMEVGMVGKAGTEVLAGRVETEAGRVGGAVKVAVVVKAVVMMEVGAVMGAVRVDLEVMGAALMVELASCTQSPPQE